MGNGLFVVRPGTYFAVEWTARVTKVMDSHFETLDSLRSVNLGRGAQGTSDDLNDYPIRWSELQGEIFYQLQADFDFPGIPRMPPPS